jgi:hypothetical protein
MDDSFRQVPDWLAGKTYHTIESLARPSVKCDRKPDSGKAARVPA